MPFSMDWLIPQRVILLTVTGDATMDEVRAIATAVETWIDQGVAPVYLLIDTTQMERFPVSVIQIHGVSRWLYHPSTGQVILLNPAQLVSFIGTIIASMAHINLRTASTQAEALQLLYQEDATLARHR